MHMIYFQTFMHILMNILHILMNILFKNHYMLIVKYINE